MNRSSVALASTKINPGYHYTILKQHVVDVQLVMSRNMATYIVCVVALDLEPQILAPTYVCMCINDDHRRKYTNQRGVPRARTQYAEYTQKHHHQF